MPDLKPCPFCGGSGERYEALNEFWIKCVRCDASTAMESYVDEATNSWNRRAKEEKDD